MPVTVNVRMKQRRKTAANWTASSGDPDELLLEGEMGLETDTGKFKFGDGVTAWNSLSYSPPVAFAAITGKPTTLAGYGITDAQPLDPTLTAWAAFNSNGMLAQTAADTFAARTITGTANELTVTNGTGVSGNPTLSLPTALTFTSKTVTGGTFSGVTLSGATTLPGTGTISSAGRIGLGTATPEYKLDVGLNSMGGYSDSTHFALWTPFDGAGWSTFNQYWSGGTSGHRFQHNGSDRFKFFSNGTLQFSVFTAGNLRTDASGFVTANAGLEGTTLRVNVAPTAAAVTQTHHIPININGTTYKLLLAS